MTQFFLILGFVITTLAPSQTAIKNPERPLNDQAGRLVKVQEVLRITDQGGNFYFQYPRLIKVAEDETIFVYDQDELLRFGQDGTFLHNFFKKGQGPGELNYVRNYTLQNKRLVVHSTNPDKIVWFDFKGTLIKDQKISDIPGSLQFQLLYNNAYFFWKFEFPARKGKPTIVDIPQVLVVVDQSGKQIEETASFPIKSYVMGGAMVQYSTLRCAPYKNRYLFISHKRDYSVNLFDAESKKVLRTFTRDYKRVKTPKDYRGAVITFEGKRYGPEQEKYLSDIDNLFIFNESLWVLTSTKDKEKRPLIDVFDFEGRYIDSFYLDIFGTLLATHKDILFVRERDEEELVHLVKYKVID